MTPEDQEIVNHMIYVEGRGQALIAEGLMSGPVSITPKGIAIYDQLMASGWKPQREIIRRMLQDRGMAENDLDKAVALFLQGVL